mgnify:CR=1 FL=1
MVMNLTALKSQEFSYIKEELTAVREAIPAAILKVIIEAPHLTEAEVRQAVELCIEARADLCEDQHRLVSGISFHRGAGTDHE